jgi:hypothetical protein
VEGEKKYAWRYDVRDKVVKLKLGRVGRKNGGWRDMGKSRECNRRETGSEKAAKADRKKKSAFMSE